MKRKQYHNPGVPTREDLRQATQELFNAECSTPVTICHSSMRDEVVELLGGKCDVVVFDRDLNVIGPG